MKHDDKIEVRVFLNEGLETVISDDYRKYIVDALLSDVCENIDETADANFTCDDIRMAFGRILMTKLNL